MVFTYSESMSRFSSQLALIRGTDWLMLQNIHLNSDNSEFKLRVIINFEVPLLIKYSLDTESGYFKTY